MGVLELQAAREKVATLQARGKQVAFTNGCFDLLHCGHLHLLKEDKARADYLLVGLNSDSSVRRLKGNKRPLLPEQERAELLDALEPVDDLVIFSESTPLRLIEEIKPDLLVKGADYQVDDIVGASSVQASGGRVYRVKLKENSGTTELINKIIRLYGGEEDG